MLVCINFYQEYLLLCSINFCFSQDKAVGLCRFFVALGETHSKIILGASTPEEQQMSTIFVSLVLVSIEAMFFFWIKFLSHNQVKWKITLYIIF